MVLQSEILNLQSEILLLAADDQAVDANGGAGHGAAKFKIIGDLGNVEEHFFQISRHRDLFDGIGKLAARDPQPGGPTGVVAGDQVGAVAHKFRYVESLGNVGNYFFWSLFPRLEKIVSRADPR